MRLLQLFDEVIRFVAAFANKLEYETEIYALTAEQMAEGTAPEPSNQPGPEDEIQTAKGLVKYKDIPIGKDGTATAEWMMEHCMCAKHVKAREERDAARGQGQYL